MPSTSVLVSQIQHKRYLIRYRAVIIAEHLFASKAQIANCNNVVITEVAWKNSVKNIESHIIRDEAPFLDVIDVTNFWGPLWVVLGPSERNFNIKG